MYPHQNFLTAYMYILQCSDGHYYTGSTKDLDKRMEEHQNGGGSNYTRKHLPVTLIYFEEFQRIDDAFFREKQVQGWSRKKKEALMNGRNDLLCGLALCKEALRQAQGPGRAELSRSLSLSKGQDHYPGSLSLSKGQDHYPGSLSLSKGQDIETKF